MTATPRESRRPRGPELRLDIPGRPSGRRVCAFAIEWDCPGLDLVSETSKCNWVLTQWSDELAAGCES